ncbi:MAG: prolyl oligopeptidase family serine peptidase [bacterium]
MKVAIRNISLLSFAFLLTAFTRIPDPDPVPPGSVCYIDNYELVCPHETTAFDIEDEHREVHFELPGGAPPPSGWPAVIMFQGSWISAEFTWHASKILPFGAYYQTQVVEDLLDHGYAVLTPETHFDGAGQWDTNNLFGEEYKSSNDHAFMLRILSEIDAGSFGPLDGTSLYAAGISSGGHMTSRMAVSYPGRFAALAIQSGSYATCAGWICTVGPIPLDHPPTLFLHGDNDPIVPIWTMQPYADALTAAGISNRQVIDPDALHEWIPAAPGEVRAWFERRFFFLDNFESGDFAAWTSHTP